MYRTTITTIMTIASPDNGEIIFRRFKEVAFTEFLMD